MFFFLRNSLADQLLLLKCLVLVFCCRLALWTLPLKMWRQPLARFAGRQSPTKPDDMQRVRRIASCVKRVSSYVPAASCLTQALVTQFLLARQNLGSTLRIGVSKSATGEFKAHAWLECCGEIIIGGSAAYRSYTVLHSLKEANQ